MADDVSARTELIRALSLLTPWDGEGLRKRRLGADLDGGYVVVDDLSAVHAAYSFGIGMQASFDRGLADAGIPVHMFDHTIEGLPEQHPLFSFHQEGIAGADDPAARVFTLEHHMRACGDIGRTDLFLKLDVEGAEFDALIAAGPGLLRSFRQIVLELHWLHRLGDPAYRARFVGALKAVVAGFTLVHVHGNNCCTVHVIEGMPVADVLELTFIRSDLITLIPSQTVYPTELDYPNNHVAPDLLLWFYPFLPVPREAGMDPFRPSLVATLRSEQEQRMMTTRMALAAHAQAISTLERNLAIHEQQRAALEADLTIIPR
jgi:hypothetical protein